MDRVAKVEDERKSWDNAPWPVKGYAGLYVLGFVLGLLFFPASGARSILLTLAGGLLFFLLLVVPIVRGWRVGWVAVSLVTVGSLFLVPSQEGAVDRIFAATHLVASTALLLHPQTQRWCRVRL